MKKTWYERRLTIIEAANLLRQREHWVRTQIRIGMIPQRKERPKGQGGPAIFLSASDVAALAVVVRLQSQHPMLPLAKEIAGVISGLSAEEFQAAADGDKFAAASGGGSIPSGLYSRGERVEKAQPDNWIDPLLWVGLRDLWERLEKSIKAYDSSVLVPAGE